MSVTNDVREASVEDVVVVDTMSTPGSGPLSAGKRRKRLIKFGRSTCSHGVAGVSMHRNLLW